MQVIFKDSREELEVAHVKLRRILVPIELPQGHQNHP